MNEDTVVTVTTSGQSGGAVLVDEKTRQVTFKGWKVDFSPEVVFASEEEMNSRVASEILDYIKSLSASVENA